jgi:hypothetical protein
MAQTTLEVLCTMHNSFTCEGGGCRLSPLCSCILFRNELQQLGYCAGLDFRERWTQLKGTASSCWIGMLSSRFVFDVLTCFSLCPKRVYASAHYSRKRTGRARFAELVARLSKSRSTIRTATSGALALRPARMSSSMERERALAHD